MTAHGVSNTLLRTSFLIQPTAVLESIAKTTHTKPQSRLKLTPAFGGQLLPGL